ncbi:hypothetical protein [Burkholderia cenocepacia]|uniref:hypothetical protein n=1 Tax=Burkholderia cenocepacia TaxID=95486 RepID=UPI0003C43CBB|nr:hypothetical protein [Burkholderia cenocepacia]ESS39066.1 hypothetical protein P355_4301 [Burkholderia cenocepacia KC-01]
MASRAARADRFAGIEVVEYRAALGVLGKTAPTIARVRRDDGFTELIRSSNQFLRTQRFATALPATHRRDLPRVDAIYRLFYTRVNFITKRMISCVT